MKLLERVVFLISASLLASLALVPDAFAQQAGGTPPPPKTLSTITVNGTPLPPTPQTETVLPYIFNAYAMLGGFNAGLISTIGLGAGSKLNLFNLFTSNNVKPTTDPTKNRNDCNDESTDPIQFSTKTENLTLPLFSVPEEMGLSYSLSYVSGSGWLDNLGYWLDGTCGQTGDPTGCTYVVFNRPDGSSLVFNGDPDTYGNFPEQGGGQLATLVHNTDNTWTLQDENANTLVFGVGGLQSITDSSGIGWTLTYTGTGSNITTHITHTNGGSFTVAKVSTPQNGVITTQVTVTDPGGNVYQYVKQVPTTGSLLHPNNPFYVSSVTFPDTPATVITYQYKFPPSSSQPTLPIDVSEVDYNAVPYLYVDYNTSGYNAIGTHLADGSESYSVVYGTNSQGQMTATIANPMSHTRTNTYGTVYSGQPLLTLVQDDAVSDCGSTMHSAQYDGNGYLKQSVDNNNITHLYNYAANGQLQNETEASGTTIARTTTYTWDPNQQLNRLKKVVVTGESETDYTYNGLNRLATVTRINLSPNGTANQSLQTTYSYTYYGTGIVKTMTVTSPSPNGTATTVTTYNSNGWPVSVADGLGHATQYSNYNALGEPGQVATPNATATAGIINYTYDGRGRLSTKTLHTTNGTSRWTYTYDGFGLLYQVVAPGTDTTTWNRDAEMRVHTMTHNDSTGMSTETFGYDPGNNVSSDVITRGSDIGKSSSTIYDGLNRVYQRKGSNGQVWTYAYDGNGNVVSITDALGHQTKYLPDALNRLSVLTDAKTHTTQYFYDAGDHLTQIIDPRNLSTTYKYDGLGLLWSQTSPDTGSTWFTYDAYGRLYTKKLAGGTIQTYYYDTINRLLKATADTYTFNWTWDTCTNGLGLLCNVADGNSTVTYGYTPEGWLASRGFLVDGTSYSLGYAYDTAGRLATIVYPDSNQANYTYTTGRVSNVSLTVNGIVMDGATNIAYRPMNLAMTAWNSANGLRNVDGFDTDMRPSGIRVPNIQSWDYGYDTADRLQTMTDNLDSTLTQTLGYDELDRLKTVTSTADNESYNYDNSGNRTSQTVNGVTTTFGIDPTSNQVLSTTSGSATNNYKYDPEGDLYGYGPGNPSQMFYYTAFERLNGSYVAGLSAHFDVNPEGQRLRKYTSLDSTWFAPDLGGTLEAEDQDNTWADYVWLNGKLVAMIRNGNVYSVHTDQTGRAEGMTNSQGTVVWRAKNFAFDRQVTAGQSSGFNLGFPGQYFDDEDNLWYNGARDYAATLGRYIESDPIGLGGGINTYTYVGNNPISNIDPLGLCDCTEFQKLAAQLAAYVQEGADETAQTTEVLGTATAISAAAELPSGGTDTPVTAFLGGLTTRTAAVAGAQDFLAAALNTIAANGDAHYFVRAAAGAAADTFVEHLGGSGPFALAASKVIGTMTGQGVENSLLLPPPPCQ